MPSRRLRIKFTGVPVASFTFSPTSGTAPLQVSFTNTSTGSGNTYAWDFENNGSTDSTQTNPVVTLGVGTYYPKLTATNAAGSSVKVSTVALTIAAVPTATTATLSSDTGSSATAGVAKNFTVTLNAAADKQYIVTWAQTGGATLSAATSLINVGFLSATITATWPSATTGSVGAAISPAVGASVVGSPITVTVSAVASGLSVTGPTSGLARALSTMFTVTHSVSSPVVLTLSDGAGGEFYSISAFDSAGQVTLSPGQKALFQYAPSSAGAKTITITNNGGLSNPAPLSYTAVAQTGSATPFRLTRGGATVATYARLQQAKDAGWQSGDVVKVAPGTYAIWDEANSVGSTLLVNNVGGLHTGINVDTLTIEAEDINNPPLLDYSRYAAISVRTGQPVALMAGWQCHNFTLRGIQMRGSAAPSGGGGEVSEAFTQKTDIDPNTGNSLPLQASVYLFDRCLFTGWGNAVKSRTSHSKSSFYIDRCVFVDNSDNYDGRYHDIYIGYCALTQVTSCTFRRTGTAGYIQPGYGHFVKSRSRTTTVSGCLLDGYMTSDYYGGANSLINTPNGGVVTVVGNVLLDYGMLNNNSSHNILRSGEQQFPTSGEPNTDPLLTTHSYLIAQNTIRQMRGYPLGDGNFAQVFGLFHIPSNNPNGQISAIGIPTYGMIGSGTMVPITTVIRNNIVAHYDSGRANEFVGYYPNNSLAQIAEISDLGYYSGTPIAGSPSVNDAPLEWTAEYTTTARSDSNRGGRSIFVPSWVPSTAWQWADIPNSIWWNYAPALEPNDTTSKGGYLSQWDFSIPCYSKANHEIYVFGGGHAGTSLNAVSRYRIGKNSPDVEFFSPATPAAMRAADIVAPDYQTKSYHSDGKAYSPHSYRANQFSDYTNEMLSAATAIGTGADYAGDSFTRPTVYAITRAGQWRPNGYYPDYPNTTWGASFCGPRAMSVDGTTLYYWDVEGALENPSTSLSKLSLVTKTHSYIGPSVINWYSRAAENGAGTILVLGDKDSGGQWMARFVSTTTGVVTPVTVSGASIPIDKGIFGVVWCPDRNYWVSVWTNKDNLFDTALLTGPLIVATITQTGANTATATIRTMATGSGAPVDHRDLGLFYDPTYGCVLFVGHPEYPVKVFRVGA